MDGRIISITVDKAKDKESLNEITIVGTERKQRTPKFWRNKISEYFSLLGNWDTEGQSGG